jgi:hypothetical protein
VTPRRAWLLPGRRQALLLAALIAAAGASLLLLPDESRSYRAVATAVAPADAPDCLRAGPEHVGDETVREAAARRARVPEDDVARATEVVATPGGALLAVAFRADTAYAAQRGAYTTVSQSLANACEEEVGERLLELATAVERLEDAEAALRAVSPLPPPPSLVAARDEAAEEHRRLATTLYEQHISAPARSTSVTAAEPMGSRRSGLEELAVPVGAALCVALALVVLRTGWRRAAAPVPA